VRHLVAALAGLVLAGCFKPTWKAVQPGQPLGPDTVVLVGSFVSDPPIEQHTVKRGCSGAVWVNGRWEPPGKVVFVQETDGNVMAFFTPDLSEPFVAESRKTPSRYDWTYLPLSGHFFVELPRARRLHLRGFTYLTNVGHRMVEVPAVVDIGPKDRVVYVGEIRLRRGARRAEFVNALEGARRAARGRGLEAVLAAPWATRLLQGGGGRSGTTVEEWGSGCADGHPAWTRL
jgi:hypothetical protein